jgi:hypothetical protein
MRCLLQNYAIMYKMCDSKYKKYVALYKKYAAMYKKYAARCKTYFAKYKKYAAKYTAATSVLFISSKKCHRKKYSHNSWNVQLFLTLASQAFNKASKERLWFRVPDSRAKTPHASPDIKKIFTAKKAYSKPENQSPQNTIQFNSIPHLLTL